ncbi:MAG: PAS domain S-box protein [Methanoregula sp.]|nr:PAS domain S-box protein [Methanoregula sp.]
MVLSRENTTRITDLLRKNPQGLSITDMVKTIGINRNTAGRYLENLLVSGQVEMRHFGMAKIYSLSNRTPHSAMLSISSDLILQLDSGLRIVYANEPFLNLIRVTSADLIGKHIEYSAVILMFDDALEPFMTILKAGVAGSEWHGMQLTKKGDRFFSCHVTPAVLNDGRKGVSVRLEDLTELRHREHALEESEARLRSIISAAPIGIGVVTERIFLEVNNRFCQMTGYKESELIGRSTRLLFLTQEEFERIGREKAIQMARTGSGTIQTRWKKKDGSVVDILLSSAPLNPADLTRGVTFTALDITQRTRAEQDLRESEERFRKLIEIAPDAVILHQDKKIIYVNPATLTLLGASHPEEMVGRSVIDFVESGSRDVVRANIQKDLEGGLSPQTELQMIRLDGTPVTVEGRGVQTLIDGRPAIMVTVRDITERKRAEEERFNSRQMLQLVLDTIPVRVFWKDLNSVFLGCNRPLALDTGYSSTEELVGKTDFDTASTAIADKYRTDDHTVMETGEPKYNFEELQVRPDGSQAWLRTSKVPLRNKTGDVIGVLGTYEDITERKRMEHELNAGVERDRQLADCSLDALIITDHSGKIITTNQAALTLFELENMEAVHGCPALRFVAPESLEDARRDFATMNPERKAIMQTYTGITARGNRVAIEALGNQITYKGSCVNIISVRDVSRRTMIEEELKKSERMYRDLTDNSIDIINHNNADFTLTYISPAIKTILGYEPEDAIGRSALDFINPGDIPAIKEIHSSLIRKETDTATLVYRMVHKDGHQVWMESTVHAITNPLTGEVSEFYNVTRDITLRKNAEVLAHHRDRILHGFATASGFLLTGRLKDPLPRVLATIGEAIDADIAYIYEDNPGSPSGSHQPIRKFHWVAKTGAMDSTPSTHKECGDKFSREWAEQLASGTWVSGIRSRFSEPIRHMLEEMGIWSILIVPIHVRNVYWGFIGFSDTRTERVWSDTEIEILMTLASTIGLVLEREKETV